MGESVEFVYNSPLKKVEINLNKELFEQNYLNNGTFLPDFEFSFLEPMPSFTHYKFTFYPLISYEYFNDGLRLGAGFWSGNILTKQYFMVGNFYYGTQSSALGYKLKITNRFPGSIGNYTDIELGIHDKDGFKGIQASASTEIIDPSDTSVRHNLFLSFNDSKLYDIDYHEKNMYEKGSYSTLNFGYTLKLIKMLWHNDLSFSIERTINLFNSEMDYTRYDFSEKFRYYISERSNILWDFYMGSVDGDNVPVQELIFAGGDIDPKHQAFIPAYRGSSAPLRKFSLNSGMQMLGHAHTKRVFLKDKSGYAMGLEFDLPYLPKVYGRMASLFDKPADFSKNDPFYEAGFKLGNQYFSLIFPLYISDPGENENNTEFRMFYNFTFPF